MVISGTLLLSTVQAGAYRPRGRDQTLLPGSDERRLEWVLLRY
jgi:hypothetical protein